MALLKIKFKLADGATTGWMKIDRAKVVIDNSKGEKTVADVLDHRMTAWFGCPQGVGSGSLDYEITQNDVSLVKGKVAISFGFDEGLVTALFQLHSVGQ